MVRSIVHRRQQDRQGATLVETAIVLPVFFLFLFGLWEFSHFYFVGNMLDAAARRAARNGTLDGTSTAQVENEVKTTLAHAFDSSKVTVRIKDASAFESSTVDASNIDYSDLPDIELNDAEPRQLFIIRVEVDYADVGIISNSLFGGWLTGKKLTGQAVMRHE